jgi:hypothetical protein
MHFDPSPHDALTLFGQEFVVQPHPEVPAMAYGQEGGRATIFKIRDRSGGDFALKVFKASFRDPRQSKIAMRLADYKELPGLRAADRRVIAARDGHLPQALDQAVVMPWICGTTWFDVLNRASAGDQHVKLEAAIHLCNRFLGVLQALEQHGAAHTDIAAGNVVIDLASLDVQLVDLEELFGAGLPAPKVTGRTPGYTRDGLVGSGGFWSADGDRFAGAILAVEILALSDPALARMSRGDSFFNPDEIGTPDSARFQAVIRYLHGLAPELAALFARTWTADTLADCATITEYARNLDALARRTPWPDVERFVRSAGAQAPAPPSHDGDNARRREVVWVPLSVPLPPPSPLPPKPPPRPTRLSPHPEPPHPPPVPPPEFFRTWARVWLFLFLLATILAVVVAGAAAD